MPKPIHWCASSKASVSSGLACRPSALSTATRPSPGSLPPAAGGRGRGDGVALHAVGQGEPPARVAAVREAIAALPVLVEHVAEAQVGDAGAADSPQARQRSAVAAHAEQEIDPVAAALERGAVVGRAEADELGELAPPAVSGELAVVAGAARHQAAHAVTDDHQLVDGHGPGGDERLELRGEAAPVGRDVQAAVVIEVDRRVAEVARQRRAVVVPEPQPLAIVAARAVEEQEQLAARLREGRAQRLPLELQRVAVAAQLHLDRQRIAGLAQVVAEHAVEHGEDDLPLGAGCAVTDQRRQRRQGEVDAGAHQLGHAANALVDQAGQGAGRARERPAEEVRPAADGLVHGLDEVGHAPGRLDRQAAGAAQIVDVVARLLRHRTMLTRPGRVGCKIARAV